MATNPKIKPKRGTTTPGIGSIETHELAVDTTNKRIYIGDADGSGILIGAAPGGSDTQVQFNDGGNLGGDSGLTYNKTTDSLTITGDLVVNNVEAQGDLAVHGAVQAQGDVSITGAAVTTSANTAVAFGSDIQIGQQFFGEGVNSPGSNIAIGKQVLEQNNFGSDNLAIGFRALRLNVDGSYNVAIGPYAMNQNDIGSYNLAIGNLALNSNIMGESNIAIGSDALSSNYDGSGNTAIGASALIANYDGVDNIAIGSGALYFGVSGSQNVAVGANALQQSEGTENTAIGNFAFTQMSSGDSNVAIGYEAGRYRGSGSLSISTANTSIFIGHKARSSSTDDQSNQIVIGANAVGLGTNTTVIGTSATTTTQFTGTTSSTVVVSGQNLRLVTQRTPASASATGVKGDICHDTNYIYVCTATNTWKRVAIASW
jgi:hypothetical protein